jgi:hypothetical protein
MLRRLTEIMERYGLERIPSTRREREKYPGLDEAYMQYRKASEDELIALMSQTEKLIQEDELLYGREAEDN